MLRLCISFLSLWLIASGASADPAEDCNKGSGEAHIAGCTQLIEKNPEDAMAYVFRGVAYSEKGDQDRAIADLSKAIEIDPEKADFYHDRGTAYWRKGDADRAIADLNQAITLDPEHVGAYFSRGYVYSVLKQEPRPRHRRLHQDR